MSGFFATLLFFHIVAGIFGIVFLTGYMLSIVKEQVDMKKLSRVSFYVLLAFLVSWVLGGYYYLNYYGKVVKPIILKGHYAWAHTVMTETKEHIFLFLPFLALSVFLVTFLLPEVLSREKKLKTAVAFLAFVAQSIALVVTVFGFIISGAVAK